MLQMYPMVELLLLPVELLLPVTLLLEEQLVIQMQHLQVVHMLILPWPQLMNQQTLQMVL